MNTFSTSVKINDQLFNKKKLISSLKLRSTLEVKPRYKRRLPAKDMPVITCSLDAYQVFRAIWNVDVIDYCEEVYCLFLTGNHSANAYSRIAEGSSLSCQVYVQKVLTLALVTNSHSFIVAHNHPSGNLEISRPDKEITRRIAQAADLVGLKLLDHLVITSCSDTPVSIHSSFPELFQV